MKTLGFVERYLMPDYSSRRQISWARVTIDEKLCTGCAMCVRACPADSLMLMNKKALMKPVDGYPAGDPGISQCLGCGDCAALCPAGAVKVSGSYRWTGYFKSLNRGELSLPRL
jgi:NADH-quinone oxidoreductase subunit I